MLLTFLWVQERSYGGSLRKKVVTEKAPAPDKKIINNRFPVNFAKKSLGHLPVTSSLCDSYFLILIFVTCS